MITTLDTETCGLHGMPVSLQYAFDDEEPKISDLWLEPIGETLDLIDFMLTTDMVFFNAAFDFFHLCKLYTTFVQYINDGGSRSHVPYDYVEELAICEEQARFLNLCLKPKRAHDVMLHARTTKYQALMDRDDIKINRVPTVLAYELAVDLEKRIPFDAIFFARAKDPLAPRWKVYDIERPDGSINPDFKTLKLKFKASSGLKQLYRHCFKITQDFYSYSDVEIGKEMYPDEVGYAPFAKALAPRAPKDWAKTWPAVIRSHIQHWAYSGPARKYASDDVIYTRRLYREEFGSPEPGDVDSTLACMVAAARWHGFAIDLPRILELKKEDLRKLGFAEDLVENFASRPIGVDQIRRFGKSLKPPAQVKAYISEVMDISEKVAFTSTAKKVLESLTTWITDEGALHPVAIRAQETLDARGAKKRIEIYDKLLLARRFHASFKIIGALSSRMSGDNGLNAQGINHSKHIRAAFPLADRTIELLCATTGQPAYQVRRALERRQLQLTSLCGGDFKSFEVSIAAKVFNDPSLNHFLNTGGKIHAVFATQLFPGKTYEEILATDGARTERDLYDIGKKALFAIFYGAEAFTLMDRYGLSEEIALKAVDGLQRLYPGIRIFGDRIKRDFGALSQPKGIGSKVEWNDPKEYIESFLGFRRYFTQENRVMRTLYHLAQDVPQSWRSLKMKVVRRDRVQTASGAVSSALYGAAFGVMSRTIRAAKNHCIQSPGAQITKATQAKIWELQPIGAGPWVVQMMNIHDEIMCSVARGSELAVESKAKEAVAGFQQTVPQLKIDWFTNIPDWSAKKGLPLEATC